MTPLSTGDPKSIGGYTLLGRLGAGGMGVVYLGVSASGRQVAVGLGAGPYAQEEEFRTPPAGDRGSAQSSGAFTAPVVDADPDADRPWMATLYVPGLNLAEVVEKDGPLSQRELRALGLGLTEALRDIQRASAGAPGPQTAQRPDDRGRAARHRLRHIARFRPPEPHHDRADDRHSALHVAGTTGLSGTSPRPRTCSRWGRCWCSRPSAQARSTPTARI